MNKKVIASIFLISIFISQNNFIKSADVSGEGLGKIEKIEQVGAGASAGQSKLESFEPFELKFENVIEAMAFIQKFFALNKEFYLGIGFPQSLEAINAEAEKGEYTAIIFTKFSKEKDAASIIKAVEIVELSLLINVQITIREKVIERIKEPIEEDEKAAAEEDHRFALEFEDEGEGKVFLRKLLAEDASFYLKHFPIIKEGKYRATIFSKTWDRTYIWLTVDALIDLLDIDTEIIDIN